MAKIYTISRAEKITQWFSDNWPSGLAWPPEIQRPEPGPDSPVAKAREAAREAAQSNPAIQLSDKGQIRNPGALCDLLDVERDTYYQATSQYALGKKRADTRPRKNSSLEVLVMALALAGDRRFVHYRDSLKMAMSDPRGKTPWPSAWRFWGVWRDGWVKYCR